MGTLNPKKWIGKIRFSSIPSDVEKFSEFDGEVIFHFVVFFSGVAVYLPRRVGVQSHRLAGLSANQSQGRYGFGGN